ncbi:MAG: hypothetical protein FWC42_07965 [Proteobacteria bacterium]|nr:hypothetical protein [Pseudomonadota bacterium]
MLPSTNTQKSAINSAPCCTKDEKNAGEPLWVEISPFIADDAILGKRIVPKIILHNPCLGWPASIFLCATSHPQLLFLRRQGFVARAGVRDPRARLLARDIAGLNKSAVLHIKWRGYGLCFAYSLQRIFQALHGARDIL